MKQQACEANALDLISLDKIKGLAQYQCGMNTIVYDSSGNPHAVEHDNVAKHPGDAGMKWIADRIVEEVKD